MQESQISFTSKIRLTTLEGYRSGLKGFSPKQFVRSPYTAKEIVKSTDAFTKGIYDCTAGGIVDGKAVVMAHIDAHANTLYGWDEIIDVLKQKIDPQSKKLHGLLIGSLNYGRSYSLFKFFEKFMGKAENSIPYTKFQHHRSLSAANTHISYKSSIDEWAITNATISKEIQEKKEWLKMMSKDELQKELKKIAEKSFVKVEVAPCDELVI